MIPQPNEPTPETEFGKHREQFLVSVRKSNRDERLSKRRNINSVVQAKVIPNHAGNNAELNARIEQQQQCQVRDLKKVVDIDDLPALARKVDSANIGDVHQGMIGIRKLLSDAERTLPIQAIIDANVVPKMIKFMSESNYPRLQMEAAWALTNIATGTSSQCQSIIDKGGIPLFVKLLSSQYPNVVEQAIWAIGNIAGDVPANRDLIIKAGGVKPLIHLATNSTDLTVIKQSTWALSNLCRGNPMPEISLVEHSVPVFVAVIKNPLIADMETIVDSCWALSYLSDGSKSAYKRIVNDGGVEKLVDFLRSPGLELLVPVLRTIGNLCSAGDEAVINEVMKYPIINNLLFVLFNDKKGIRREACWVLANIAASSNTLQIMTRVDLMTRLMELLENDAAEVRRQIMLILGNLTIKGNPQQLLEFYRHYQVMRYMAALLKTDDVKGLISALRTIFRLLGVGEIWQVQGMNVLKEELNSYGAIDTMEELQKHKSEDVYKQVMRIFTEYYEILDPMD